MSMNKKYYKAHMRSLLIREQELKNNSLRLQNDLLELEKKHKSL